jgi:hypothetical protein
LPINLEKAPEKRTKTSAPTRDKKEKKSKDCLNMAFVLFLHSASDLDTKIEIALGIPDVPII